MRETFADLCRHFDNDDPFRRGRPFKKAYLADLYEVMIERQIPIHWSPIDGGWREIDTVEDLQTVDDVWSDSASDEPR